MSKWLMTVMFLFVSAILSHWLPFSSFFRNLDTMIHEFGHALATLLLSGQVLHIYLFADHSGVTLSAVDSGWQVIPVALAGYAAASLFAVYLFGAYRSGKQRQGLGIITLLSVVSLAFFVRNGFGILWLVGFIALNMLVTAWAGNMLRNLYYLFVAFLTLEESVFGPISLTVAAVAAPGQAGDASALAQASGLPAAFWASLFTVFALYCAKNALQRFFDRPASRRSRGSLPVEISDTE